MWVKRSWRRGCRRFALRCRQLHRPIGLRKYPFAADSSIDFSNMPFLKKRCICHSDDIVQEWGVLHIKMSPPMFCSSLFNPYLYGQGLEKIVTMRKTALFASLFLYILSICAQIAPKREFRGAWIQCVNSQFIGMTTGEIQRMLVSQLDELEECGINVVIFQVRPEFDALYQSSFEPWSRYLTGRQGSAPSPYWDPLEWMVRECHARGMELHAWINPYRAKTKSTTELSKNHPYFKYPERFFKYGDQIIMDPGIPENRLYLCNIVTDILLHYDVDGIHIDDYFYPYPESGRTIPDGGTYAVYGGGMDKGDWRRDNVNKLIELLYDCIHSVKPWVKFGVSPFGIYRNLSSDPAGGSNTRGLQNYDDLYADVLKWVDEGWVDYLVPQLYWEIGNASADYETLARWWSKHAGGRPLVFGQDVERTVKYADPATPKRHQMARKMALQRALPNVVGSCMWYAKAVTSNIGNYAVLLKRRYHRHPALQPLMPWIDGKKPNKVRGLTAAWTADGYMLLWQQPKGKGEMDRARQYVVYRFDDGEKININYGENIVAVTSNTFYKLPYKDGTRKYTYVVTALDRLQNESKEVKKKVKL